MFIRVPSLILNHSGVISDNNNLKTNIIGKKRPINKAQMKSNVEDFMYKRKNDRKQVQKYFHATHIRYAD